MQRARAELFHATTALPASKLISACTHVNKPEVSSSTATGVSVTTAQARAEVAACGFADIVQPGETAAGEVAGTSQALLVKHSSAAKTASAQESSAGMAICFREHWSPSPATLGRSLGLRSGCQL